MAGKGSEEECSRSSESNKGRGGMGRGVVEGLMYSERLFMR